MDSSFREAEARALFDRVRDVDGRSPDAPPDPVEFEVVAERDPESGDLAAIAWRSQAEDPAELYVDPRYRGRGIGRRLAGRLFERPGRIWAHGTLPAAVHLAAAFDAVTVRELLQLRAPLPAVAAEAEVPAGVTLRTFRPGADDAEFLRVNASAFAWHPEQGRLDQHGLNLDKAQPWFDADGFFLAVPSGQASPGGPVLGFHWTKVHPAGTDGAEPIGEIYVLAVDPASPVKHLGGPLTAAGLNYLTAKGLKAALLYVESDNEPALKLYRRFGFTEHTRDTVFAARR